jgi:hypothetical protein
VWNITGIEVEPAQTHGGDEHGKGRHCQQCFEDDSQKGIHRFAFGSVGQPSPVSQLAKHRHCTHGPIDPIRTESKELEI